MSEDLERTARSLQRSTLAQVRVGKGLRVLLLALCLGVLLVGVGSPLIAQASDFEALVEKAAIAYADADYERALQLFEEAYALEPNTALLYNMGRVCEEMAEFDKAVNYYTLFVKSPEIDHEVRSEALERIKTLKEVIALKPAVGITTDCVDINKATATELQQLTGIGPKKAADIIADRNTKGAYSSVDDLTRISGIGTKTVEKLRAQVCPIEAASNASSTPEDKEPKLNEPSPATASGKVDFNRASLETLQALPGLGPTKAKKIIEYREAAGPFQSCEEVQKVPGIGPTSFEKLQPFCYVE
ncbi:MAG: ComEA family DNA-binding protein [Myxococcota bacterium]|jgi:competence protein ComEA|nr:ComEA family DNA-binding protein [Myxococcota bacterium]